MASTTVSSLSLTASILHFFVWQMTCQLVVMFWSTTRNLFIVKCSKEIRIVFNMALFSIVFLLNNYITFSAPCLSWIICKFCKSPLCLQILELFEFAELSGSESEAVFCYRYNFPELKGEWIYNTDFEKKEQGKRLRKSTI